MNIRDVTLSCNKNERPCHGVSGCVMDAIEANTEAEEDQSVSRPPDVKRGLWYRARLLNRD